MFSSARLRVSAVLGFLAILLGALGAHGKVHDLLVAAGELDHWNTAVEYHLPHAILTAVLAIFGAAGGKRAVWAWSFLIAGMLLFSGSLYVLALTGKKWLGAVTPFGGLSLMLGWLTLAFTRWEKRC
ncbi:MAG: DUF423 domain-containing protein [Verrucomicrobiaceae bacterium]|jgi:uncharacterized membrane protein YgdD (TMEM256/DUF423 family)|nr:DUF423 domain-containing protein [Verrucomicrobiaceae bacterium]